MTATGGTGTRAKTATQTVTVTVTNVDEPGAVGFEPSIAEAGTAVTAEVRDPDGGVTSVTWQWSKSPAQDGTFADITTATSESYTPAMDDVGAWLRATASYTDALAAGRSAARTMAQAVRAARALEAPEAPSGLTAEKDGRFAIDLSWTAPGFAATRANATGYVIQRAAAASGPWSELATTTTPGLTTYKDSGLSAGATWHYRLKATSASGDSPWSGTASATTGTNGAPAFASPTASRSVAENAAAGTAVGEPVTATDADGDALTYTLGGADAGSFEIDGTSGQVKVKAGALPDFEAKSSHTVTVTASDGHGGSASVTVTISVTDVDEPPAAPTGLSVSAQGATTLRATWSAPENAGRPAISGYDVEYREGTSGDWSEHTHSGTAVTADITGLTTDTVHEVRVRAKNADGEGPWTSPVSGTPSR